MRSLTNRAAGGRAGVTQPAPAPSHTTAASALALRGLSGHAPILAAANAVTSSQPGVPRHYAHLLQASSGACGHLTAGVLGPALTCAPSPPPQAAASAVSGSGRPFAGWAASGLQGRAPPSSSCGPTAPRAFSTSSACGGGGSSDDGRIHSGSSSSSTSASTSGSGGAGGGSWGDGLVGLPPPTIISPVPLRVVVIGWMGSNRRYLNKYGGLWARSGDHEVLLIRPSVAQTLVRWRGVVVAGRDIDRVARMHRENPAMPTVYHIFSTGGFIHAGTMWRWMDEVEDVAQRRDLLEEVKGIIFDSAPASVNPEMASRAIVSAVTNTPAEELSYGMPGVQGALLGGTRAFLDRYLQSSGVKLRTEEVYDAWYNLAPVCPQLYLYSDADPLVPAADVERYMAIQEGRGVEASGYKWSDSGHVEHYRRHPHEYAYQISAFLARALKDW